MQQSYKRGAHLKFVCSFGGVCCTQGLDPRATVGALSQLANFDVRLAWSTLVLLTGWKLSECRGAWVASSCGDVAGDGSGEYCGVMGDDAVLGKGSQRVHDSVECLASSKEVVVVSFVAMVEGCEVW